MSASDKTDAARVELMLSELRLPGAKLAWAALAARADKEGWPAARFLAALAEQELAERNRRNRPAWAAVSRPLARRGRRTSSKGVGRRTESAACRRCDGGRRRARLVDRRR
jgi:hypothetical protein